MKLCRKLLLWFSIELCKLNNTYMSKSYSNKISLLMCMFTSCVILITNWVQYNYYLKVINTHSNTKGVQKYVRSLHESDSPNREV